MYNTRLLTILIWLGNKHVLYNSDPNLRKQGPQPAGISAQARLEVGSFEAMSDGGVSSHWTQYIDLIIGGITKIFQGCTTLVILACAESFRILGIAIVAPSPQICIDLSTFQSDLSTFQPFNTHYRIKTGENELFRLLRLY